MEYRLKKKRRYLHVSCLQLLQCHSKRTVSVLTDVHLHVDDLLNCMNLLILYLIIYMNLRVVFMILCICLFVVFTSA